MADTGPSIVDSEKHGQDSTNFVVEVGRFRGQCLSNFEKYWATPEELWSNLADSGPYLADQRPPLVNVGPLRLKFGRVGETVGRVLINFHRGDGQGLYANGGMVPVLRTK